MRLLATLVLVGILAACGDEPAQDSASTTDPPAESTTTGSGGGGRPLSESEQATLDAAVADLADRIGASTDQVAVVSFEAVTWNDGSLGCPQPGMMYTQALVDGWRMVLEVEGTTYDYHAGSDGEPFLCEEPTLKPGPDPSLTIPSDPER